MIVLKYICRFNANMICHKYLIIHILLFISRVSQVNLQASERTIQNPGYVELAKCPCDVTENSCDFNCCCDKECTVQDKARFFSCIPGLPGGQGGAKEAYRCGTKEFNPPDWHQLTCVYWENNAYLGMFFMNKAKIVNKDAFTSVVTKYMEDKYSLSEQEARYLTKESTIVDYRKGLTLTTTRQPNVASTLPDSDGVLSMPQQINSGQCNLLVPVRFLEPVQSSCSFQLTTSSCSALTSFDANIYAISSTINAATKPFQVRSTFKSNNPDVAVAEVRYYCTTDLTGSSPPSSGSNFPNTLQNVNCDEPCSTAACWQYNTDRTYTSLYDRALPSRCAFDNGQTLPQSPSMSAGTCQNVVLEVRYTFQWAGPKIEKLTADVILANVAGVSPSTPIDIPQRFTVKWTHVANTTTSSSFDDNFYNSSQPYERSGIAGYELNKPLRSGCVQNDAVNNQFETVDTQTEKQMAIFRPGVDGLCGNAQREGLTFGEDVMSSCALSLTFDDLTSCDNLRQLVGNHLNVLMPSDVIGRYGYNDPNNQDNWIAVLRQNLTTATASIVTTTAPSALLGNETGFRLADHVTGVCLLPTSVSLKVVYAKTGAINFHPRLEVIGAYVDHTFSNWTMECMGSNSQRCDSTSGQTQKFYLHSTVRFVEVPAVPPTPKESFYTKVDPETCDTDTCQRFYKYWATDVCYYDTCWQEIAYPLTSVYEGDSHEYALAFFLVLVLGILGYASVTKPGWNYF